MRTRKSNGQRATLLTLALLIPPLFLPACPKNEPPPRPQARVSRAPQAAEPPAPIPATFNGERAMDHVKKQIEFGPRPPGSSQLEKTRTYIVNQLKSYGLNVSLDQFTAATPQGEKKMTNVVAELPGETKDLILIASHYDTKYFKDMLFVGANDPAASVGALLEIGRVLGTMKEKPRLTYRLVFFDGEEAFIEWSGTDHTYGSRYYVEQARSAGTLKGVRAMILVDMIGDRDLALRREARSTRWLTDALWASAKRLGYGEHFLDEAETIEDDHVNFLSAGVPAVDLIDLQYRAWHTADDTLDQVSARSLQVVGDVILDALPAIEKAVAKKGP